MGGFYRADGRDGDHWQHAGPFPDRRRLLEIANAPGIAKTAPDTAFAYSNVGYALLGLVVEAASGMSYAECLAERIARPLGLRDTAAEHLPERADEYAAASTSLRTSNWTEPLPATSVKAACSAGGNAAPTAASGGIVSAVHAG